MQAFNMLFRTFFRIFLLALLSLTSSLAWAQCGDTVVSSGLINTFPYQEDFENGPAGWFHAPIQSNYPNPTQVPQPPHFPGIPIPDTWAFGSPSKTRLTGANSGDSCWTNGGLTGNYALQEHSFVVSPYFDFSTLTNPFFGLYYKIDTEANTDGVCIQTSIDSGKTWIRVGGANTGPNWYNRRGLFSSPGVICGTAKNQIGWGGRAGWRFGQHDIGYLAGQPRVLFRVVFASDFINSNFEGFAFDDVAIMDRPSRDLGPDTVLCLGSQKVYDLGPVPNGSYLWLGQFTGQTYTVVTNPSGLAQRIIGCVTDTVLGFTFCDSVLVNSSLLTQPVISDTVFCAGDSVRYSLFNPGAMYTWQSYDSALQSFVPISNNRILSTDTSGLYIYSVFDNLGCVFSDTIEARLETPPPINLGPGDTVCIGNSRVYSAPSGPPGTTYEWRLNAIGAPFANTQTIFASAPGKYTVTLITPGGCTSTDSVNFGVELAPVVDLGPDSRECYDLTLNANNPGASFIWNTGATTQTITVTPPFTGWVEVTNSLGCSARDSIVITQGIPPSVDLGGDRVLCDQSSIILDPGNQPTGSTIRWCSGQFQQALLVTTPGLYCVEVTDVDGCIGTDTVDITISALRVDLGPDAFLCDGESATLDAEFPGASYLWNTNATTSSIQITSGGIYGVVLSDTLGCVKSDSITITQRPPYVASIGFPANQYVQFGTPHTFTSTNNPPGTNSWTWIFGDENIASGQTVNHTYASLDTFTICLVMSDGICTDTVCDLAGNFLVFINIEDELGINDLQVHPNPAQHELFVQAESVSYTHLRAHETVLDLVCRLLLEKKKETI